MLTPSFLTQITAAVATGLVGGFARGISGFGAALVMVPMLSLVVPAREAVVAVVVTTFVSSVPMAIGLRREADLRAVLGMALGAVLALPLGTWLLVHLSSDALRRVAALVVIGTALGLALIRPASTPLAPPWRVVAGFVSGVLNGAVSLGGPRVVLYFLSTNVSAETSRASFVTYFALLQVAQVTLVLAPAGLLTSASLTWVLIIAPCMFVGSYLGSVLFRAGGHLHFRVISLALLGATGFAALFP
ncbi:MAG: sulfite exporter TauE/SafE family protein [Polyangiales bacterium]